MEPLRRRPREEFERGAPGPDETARRPRRGSASPRPRRAPVCRTGGPLRRGGGAGPSAVGAGRAATGEKTFRTKPTAPDATNDFRDGSKASSHGLSATQSRADVRTTSSGRPFGRARAASQRRRMSPGKSASKSAVPEREQLPLRGERRGGRAAVEGPEDPLVQLDDPAASSGPPRPRASRTARRRSRRRGREDLRGRRRPPRGEDDEVEPVGRLGNGPGRGGRPAWGGGIPRGVRVTASARPSSRPSAAPPRRCCSRRSATPSGRRGRRRRSGRRGRCRRLSLRFTLTP